MPSVVVAQELPELLDGIPEPRRDRAAAATAAELVSLPTGEWRPRTPEPGEDADGHFGLLVLEGLLVRRVHLGNRACVELIGAGDVLRPWALDDEASSIAVDARWTVQQKARIAVLDRRFSHRVAAYPEIAAALMDRQARRTQWLAFHLAVCHLPHLQTRLHVMFWFLADRWGKVTPRGTALPLRLTHALLGGLVGARRPATTTALGELVNAGVVERLPDGGWMLLGDRPDELEQLDGAALSRRYTARL
jgi:CRP-like cAMP-binding protein